MGVSTVSTSNREPGSESGGGDQGSATIYQKGRENCKKQRILTSFVEQKSGSYRTEGGRGKTMTNNERECVGREKG